MNRPLAQRPIFHQLERRVDGNSFLRVLAYHLLVAIETTLASHDQHNLLVIGPRGSPHASGGHDRAADRRGPGSADPQSNYPRTAAHGNLPVVESPGRDYPTPTNLEHPPAG